jgi:hypothetical protein
LGQGKRGTLVKGCQKPKGAMMSDIPLPKYSHEQQADAERVRQAQEHQAKQLAQQQIETQRQAAEERQRQLDAEANRRVAQNNQR